MADVALYALMVFCSFFCHVWSLELVASPTPAPCQHAVRSRLLLPSRRAGARFASDTYGAEPARAASARRFSKTTWIVPCFLATSTHFVSDCQPCPDIRGKGWL
jgi:hypothetical protein